MRLVTILIALCWIEKSLQMVEFHEEKVTLNQIVCVNTALKTYLKNHQNIWIFSKNSPSPVQSLLRVPLIVITEWNLLHEGLSLNTGSIIIFLEGKADEDFDGLERLQDIIVVGPVIIVCITDTACSSAIYLNGIADVVASAKLHYIAIDESRTIDVYERTSTAEGACGIAKLFRIGHCSDYPSAKKAFQSSVNFHKCPIRVVTWVCPPYSQPCNSSDDSDQLCGIAGSVVHMVTEKVNATPVLLTVQTPEDVRQHVANRDADLGYGGLDIRSFESVSFSKPYMFVQATVIAPFSTWILKSQSFGNILQPLENKVWLGIGLTILSVLVLQRLVPHFRTIQTLQLFGILLGIAVPRQPQGLSNRVYFLSLVLFGYLCSQLYLTNLTKVLSAPQQGMIRTLRDLENSKLRVIGPATEEEKFKDEYPRIYKDFQAVDEADYYDGLFELLRGHSDGVYYVEDLDKNIAEWKNVEALRDRFNWYTIALVAPNTSLVLETGNAILMRIWESGVVNGYITFTSSYELPTYRQPSSFENSADLGFDELKGVFLLLVGGLTISSLVFMTEILTAFVRKKPELKEERVTRSSITHPELLGPRSVHGILKRPRQTFYMP